MMGPAVAVERLNKTYRVYARPWERLIEPLGRKPRHRPFHALKDVSLALQPGEAVGIIGENGAGKSTLLKILAGITAPTSGSVVVRGKVASILELGSGFHPELTGRQNIVLNAAMLGLGKADLEAKLPSIVTFSELGTFIDQPLKHYSTGMAMRLGFAIAVQVEPDVLIIDEALSVGDGYFQKKCMDRLRQYLDGGGTLLFCSHAMYYVSAFCHRALWLRGGETEALGPVEEVVRAYEAFLDRKSATASEEPVSAAVEQAESGGPVKIRSVRLLAQEKQREETPLYTSGEPWELDIAWEAKSPALRLHLGVGINRCDGIEVSAFATHQDGLPPFTGSRRYQTRLVLPALPLVKGEFTLYVFLLDEEGLHVYDQMIVPTAFRVRSEQYRFGLVRLPHHWEGEQAPLAATPNARHALREEVMG